MSMLLDPPLTPTVADPDLDAEHREHPADGAERAAGARPAGEAPPASTSSARPTDTVGFGRMIDALIVGFFCFLVFWTVSKPHLPNLGHVFDPNTTATGGDMGTHVWGPDFVRRELVHRLRPTGWTNDWYAGFPVLQFYFPLPTWMIVALSYVMPANVAFKLVTVLGLVFMPLAGWSFGKNAGMRRPYPVLMACAVVPFVFVRRYWIYGGNIMSTMAGEFSFSNSLCLAFVFLGLWIRVVRTGRKRGWAAVAFAGMALSHLLPTIFSSVLAAALLGTHIDAKRWRRQLTDAALVAAAGLGLTAFWSIPFKANLAYSNTMGFEKGKITTYMKALFPWLETQKDIRPGAHLAAGATVLAVIATVAMLDSLLAAVVQRQRRAPIAWLWPALALIAVTSVFVTALLWNKVGPTAAHDPNTGRVARAADGGIRYIGRHAASEFTLGRVLIFVGVFVLLCIAAFGWALRSWDRIPAALVFTLVFYGLVVRYSPVSFRLWNARALPFWDLTMFLLAAYGVAAIGRTVIGVAHWLSEGRRGFPLAPNVATVLAATFTYLCVAPPLQGLPGWVPIPKVSKGLLGIQQVKDTQDRSNAAGWPTYNYEGYQRKGAWPEFRSLVDTMLRVGKDHGCGRAMWENAGSGDDDLGRFGTPMALMTLPYWTKSCIGSMEGLYFESSATTPYHFMNASLTAKTASKAQRDLPYSDSYDMVRGTRKLQEFGVRYFIAFSDEIVTASRANADLTEVAQSGRFRVFLVNGSDLVAPLAAEPLVATGIGEAQNDGWLDVGVKLYNNPETVSGPVTIAGPKSWQRVKVTIDEKEKKKGGEVYGVGTKIEPGIVKPLPPVKVSDIRQGTDTLSFTVDKVNVPVLVKVSYFPNWTASGAKGPWRVFPNFMVVVPTQKQVKLHYGTSTADYLGRFVTLAALGGVFVLRRVDRRRPDDDPDLDPDLDSADPSERDRDHAVERAGSDETLLPTDAAPDPTDAAAVHGGASLSALLTERSAQERHEAAPDLSGDHAAPLRIESGRDAADSHASDRDPTDRDPTDRDPTDRDPTDLDPTQRDAGPTADALTDDALADDALIEGAMLDLDDRELLDLHDGELLDLDESQRLDDAGDDGPSA